VPSSASASFYFGAMSPYSWLTAERIERLLPNARWRGVLAGALFKQAGRVSWGLTERRAAGIADCEERAAAHGLGPIVWPDPWPTSDLLIARAMSFCELHPGAAASEPTPPSEHNDRLLRAFALAAMRLEFLEGVDLGELDAVIEAGRRAGIEEAALRDGLQAPAVKDTLRAITAEAVAGGVFGVPTICVGGQLFWGDDRLAEATAAAATPAAAAAASAPDLAPAD
jgi:2-hydroxychromene-2-carboxylate isomerase